ncbi:MAG: FtsX-like permease family protein [Fimbriimonadales bacterium]
MKQRDPKLGVAFVQALKTVRHRPGRQMAAALGIVIAIALFASVRSGRVALPEATTGTESAETVGRVQWLVYLSLLLCFTSITNSMLMSVTERFKEIGTLKCLGATNRFIIKMFFLESALIGFISSIVGGVFGIGIVAVLRSLTGNSATIPAVFSNSASTLSLSVLVGTAITILAAIAPSYQASKMPAAAALRVEI